MLRGSMIMSSQKLLVCMVTSYIGDKWRWCCSVLSLSFAIYAQLKQKQKKPIKDFAQTFFLSEAAALYSAQLRMWDVKVASLQILKPVGFSTLLLSLGGIEHDAKSHLWMQYVDWIIMGEWGNGANTFLLTTK